MCYFQWMFLYESKIHALKPGNTLLNKEKLGQNVLFVTERQTEKSTDDLKTVTKRTRLRGNETNGKSKCEWAEETESLRVHAGRWCSRERDHLAFLRQSAHGKGGQRENEICLYPSVFLFISLSLSFLVFFFFPWLFSLMWCTTDWLVTLIFTGTSLDVCFWHTAWHPLSHPTQMHYIADLQ